MWLTSGGKFEQAACNHAVNGVFITWVGMGSSHFVIWFPCWICTSERWCDLFKGSLSAFKNCFEVCFFFFFFAENRLHMFQNWCSAGKASWSHFAPFLRLGVTYLYDSPSRATVCWPSVKPLTQLGSCQACCPQKNDRPRVPCEPFWHLGQGDDSDTHMCFFSGRCTSARPPTC